MIQLRDYQKKIVSDGLGIVKEHGLLYLSMEVRTGKTLTSLAICNELHVSEVLFLTKLKVIPGIKKDYNDLGCNFNLTCINYDSMHKIENKKWDVIICDESHGLGNFAKPSKRAKQVKDLVHKNKCDVIFLSGTPTPESYSQIYHQLYVHPNNPFKQYANFYRWANDYVKVKVKYIGQMRANDYSGAIRDKVMGAIKHLMISFTQEQAGFSTSVEEAVLRVKMRPLTYRLTERLKKDSVVQGDEDTILADTGVKMMNKLHQMYSGTIILESGKRLIFDYTKAEYIKEQFRDKKIGIFYKFKAEWDALKFIFGDELTDNLEEFNSTNKNIALQIQSGREGISLRNADFLVYYNIDFSATSYWQSRDRMTTMERKFNKIYWVFTIGGIEEKVYEAVQQKKDFTLNFFRKDFLYL
jgi:hypothetical protein